MKSVRHTLFSEKYIPEILIEVTAPPAFISWMRNYILPSIPSMVVTLIIACLRQPGELCEDGYVRTV